MRASMKDIGSMDGLFMFSLGNLYYLEKRIMAAVLGRATTTADMVPNRTTELLLAEARDRIAGLERVFRACNAEAKFERCVLVDVIVGNAEQAAISKVGDQASNFSSETILAYRHQRIETLVDWAQQLGLEASIPLLKCMLTSEPAPSFFEAALSIEVEVGLDRMAA